MIDYLALALAPGIFWLWFFWRKDKFEREPALYLIKTFLLGAVVVIPAGLIEEMLTINNIIIDSMMVGIVEEAAKFLAVYLYVYRKSEFDEVMDGIVYSAAASLGFASLENLLYIYSFGPEVMILRAVISTLAHVLFGSFWGYGLGLKKMQGKNAVAAGLILAMAAHGIFDIILSIEYFFGFLLVIPLMIILYRVMSGRIRKSLAVSPFKERVRKTLAMPPSKKG